ncbi:uncharacterized protein C2orf42 homolog [Lepeophtheirus salmonis]|uniref:uncharacterized protein C2orf42 homolog n=1 Tax=Lepeophtheirus salmonis TaxID=72036 RepID=UPI001AEAB04A|nr:uncharacterized protein C2orf42 homolog [Lepeophtheirus salmonis]
MSGMNQSLFGGLGKATRRGIRKCPKCNTVNGTRGLSCKNKSCEFVFKEPNPDGKKLICPSLLPGTLYSVRHSSSSRSFIYTHGNESRCTECSNGPCRRLSPIPSAHQEAIPFTLKVSILNEMSFEDSLKHEIYSRAKEPGPLVQRVSRSWMVVKKSSHEESQLPYVHIRFGVKFYNCSCADTSGKCFHFLASLAVFAGDPVLSKEFSRFTALLSDEMIIPPSVLSIQDQNGETLQVSVVEDDLHKELDFLSALDEPVAALSVDEHNELISLPFSEDIMSASSSPNCFLSQTSPSKRLKNAGSEVKDIIIEYSFLEWLASVTERINQCMHYQFDGRPSPLIFHAPQAFFNQLRERISSVSKKTCFLNTTTLVRKDSLPIGTFIKYSWSITNIFHVKDIFDTDDVPLEITQTFSENKDGTYDVLPPLAQSNKRSLLISNNNNNSVRSPELKTYLKVGQMSFDCKDTTPFVIEWIPDILPIMKVGELRVKFEYGHNRNGVLDKSPRFRSTHCLP